MESVQAQAFEVFNLLSKHEQYLVYELMVRLVPDDVATPEDIAAHNAAIEEYRRGEVFDYDEIDWN